MAQTAGCTCLCKVWSEPWQEHNFCKGIILESKQGTKAQVGLHGSTG